MYEDGKEQLKAIITLTAQCPQELKEKCFEILLQGYVDSKLGKHKFDKPHGSSGVPLDEALPEDQESGNIPENVAPRMKTMAKRLKISIAKFSELFDFTVDPFTFHAFEVPGKNKAEKTRNVALLGATKSYLISGQWRGDWAEVKAMCVNQNCYDRANMNTNLTHDNFKTVNSDSGITLSTSGTKAAEKLIAKLAGAEGDT